MNQKRSLIILDKFTKFDDFLKSSFNEIKIIAMDFETHQKLEKMNILHELSDQYLDKLERKELYDHVLSKYDWYNKIHRSSNFESNKINILSLMSSLEFHEFLLTVLIKFFSLKNILESNHANQIFISKTNSKFIKLIDNKVEIKSINSIPNIEKGFSTDKIEIRFNILSRPVSFYLSKKTFSFLKSKYEQIVCGLNSIWLNHNFAEDIILLVEFNSSEYLKLIKTLSKSKKQLVLLNRRRPVILEKNTLEIIKSNNIKILDPQKFLNVNGQDFISEKERIVKNIEQLWDDKELFSIFSLNNTTYWPLIKDRLENIFNYRLDDYLKFIFQSKNFLKKLKIKQIICLGESGETENVLLGSIDNYTDSILLQHSFLRYNEELKNLQWRYEDQNMIGLKSKKFFLWGENDFKFFSELMNLDKSKIFISGSPKHDDFFESRRISQKKQILITLSPISDRSGLGDVDLMIKYNQLLTNLLSKLKKIPNYNLIVKLHPGENHHNFILLDHLKQIPDITILQTKTSTNFIQDCEVLINISPELYDSSTIMLEGLLFQKPVIQLTLDDEFYNIKPIDTPIIQIYGLDNFDEIFEKILTDKKFKQSFIEIMNKKLTSYISYQNHSSEKILELINNE